MPTQSQRIFISYRRAEASDQVGRLHDWLVNRRHRVFIDIDMKPGDPFRIVIAEALRDCKALLAVIGPGWLDARDAQGRRRLNDPQDLVRVEIETALQRGVLVVPVLVNDAAMPAESDLPGRLAELAHRQALPLRSETFQFDVARLLAAVEPQRKPPHLRVLVTVSGILLLVASVSTALAAYTMTGPLFLVMSDVAAAAALAVLGFWLSLDQWRRPIAAGVLLGVTPFVLLRTWRSAVLRGVPLSESAVQFLSVTAAVALVILLLAIDPAAGFRYERPRGDVIRTMVPVGALACVALAAVGVSLPTSPPAPGALLPADLGTLRFSDPLVLLSAIVLALLATISRGTLRGAILAGWALGATAVLVNTIWLRSYSGFPLLPVMNAHLLLSVLTVAVLIAVAVLALREKPSTAAR